MGYNPTISSGVQFLWFIFADTVNDPTDWPTQFKGNDGLHLSNPNIDCAAPWGSGPPWTVWQQLLWSIVQTIISVEGSGSFMAQLKGSQISYESDLYSILKSLKTVSPRDFATTLNGNDPRLVALFANLGSNYNYNSYYYTFPGTDPTDLQNAFYNFLCMFRPPPPPYPDPLYNSWPANPGDPQPNRDDLTKFGTYIIAICNAIAPFADVNKPNFDPICGLFYTIYTNDLVPEREGSSILDYSKLFVDPSKKYPSDIVFSQGMKGSAMGGVMPQNYGFVLTNLAYFGNHLLGD